MAPRRKNPVHPDDVRMTFGEHLEELRTYLIRALLGVAVGAVICWLLKGFLLGFITRPVYVVLKSNGLEPTMMNLAPADSFLVALKLAVLAGVVLASPWVLYQIWKFVGVGLYPNEQRFVKMFLPASIVLFFVGVAFLFFVVMPMVIQFFVTFSQNWPVGESEPTFFEKLILSIDDTPQTQPATQPVPMGSSLNIPIVYETPDHLNPGDIWYNARTNQLCLQTDDELVTSTFRKSTGASALTNQFSIKDYTSFVLLLSLAFGIAFQTPIVVLFLALTNIASVQAMARSRRYVIFSTVVIGAVLTPPDVVSQIMLAIPMWFLFEGGLITARIFLKKEAAAKESPTSADRR